MTKARSVSIMCWSDRTRHTCWSPRSCSKRFPRVCKAFTGPQSAPLARRGRAMTVQGKVAGLRAPSWPVVRAWAPITITRLRSLLLSRRRVFIRLTRFDAVLYRVLARHRICIRGGRKYSGPDLADGNLLGKPSFQTCRTPERLKPDRLASLACLLHPLKILCKCTCMNSFLEE
jgi:hypothetical protein